MCAALSTCSGRERAESSRMGKHGWFRIPSPVRGGCLTLQSLNSEKGNPGTPAENPKNWRKIRSCHIKRRRVPIPGCNVLSYYQFRLFPGI